MKLIIEKKSKVSTNDHVNLTLFFSGTGSSFSPSNLKKEYSQELKTWGESNNTKLLILKPYEPIPKRENVEKIVGFSGGAAQAYLASKKYPRAKLVLIDPWLATWRLKNEDLKTIKGGIDSGDIEYHGTSKEIARVSKTGADNLSALKLIIPDLYTKNKKHEQYFKEYFKI
tara:strand:- start:578 stop:1090 length:513 start_codon:yes stop_codon:yes gene_type:complete